MNKLRFFCFFLFLTSATWLNAASFDCTKASTKVEHLICDTPSLSALDVKLNTLYKQKLQTTLYPDLTKKIQLTWLKMRNACADADCLAKSYQTKIDSLGTAYEYFFKSNPYIPLCIEFKAYLERHADKPLYCNLIPDDTFKDFRLPQWAPAPKELGLRIEVQSSIIPSDYDQPYSLEKYQSLIKSAYEYAVPPARYRVAKIDLNHDGELDNILDRDNPTSCAQKKWVITDQKPTVSTLILTRHLLVGMGTQALVAKYFFIKTELIRSIHQNLVLEYMSLKLIMIINSAKILPFVLLTGQETSEALSLKRRK